MPSRSSLIQMLHDLDTLKWSPKLCCVLSFKPLVLSKSPPMSRDRIFDLRRRMTLNAEAELFDEYRRDSPAAQLRCDFLTSFELRALHQAISSGEDPVAYFRKPNSTESWPYSSIRREMPPRFCDEAGRSGRKSLPFASSVRQPGAAAWAAQDSVKGPGLNSISLPSRELLLEMRFGTCRSGASLRC